MDGDGQHPPEMIPQMIELFEQGYDIVQAQRIEEEGVSLSRPPLSGFYSLINRISGTQMTPGAADFRGLSRQAVDALKSMPEYHRFLRGMIAWMGYRSVILPYHETERVAGKSKYSSAKMLRLAMDAVFSFSLVPLYIGLSDGRHLLLPGCARDDLCAFLLGHGRTSQPGAGLELAHVRVPDRQWDGDDPARVYRRLCRLHLPGSQTQACVFIEGRMKDVSPSEKPVYRFVFLRHAESVGNVESRWQGQSRLSADREGTCPGACALAERWKKEDVKFDLVITSTLVRAQETAQIVTSYLDHIKIEFNPILMERHIGEMEGTDGG
jgi:hypothetical protein